MDFFSPSLVVVVVLALAGVRVAVDPKLCRPPSKEVRGVPYTVKVRQKGTD